VHSLLCYCQIVGVLLTISTVLLCWSQIVDSLLYRYLFVELLFVKSVVFFKQLFDSFGFRWRGCRMLQGAAWNHFRLVANTYGFVKHVVGTSNCTWTMMEIQIVFVKVDGQISAADSTIAL